MRQAGRRLMKDRRMKPGRKSAASRPRASCRKVGTFTEGSVFPQACELQDAAANLCSNEKPQQRCRSPRDRIDDERSNDEARHSINPRKLRQGLAQARRGPNDTQHTHDVNEHQAKGSGLEEERGRGEAERAIDAIDQRNQGFRNEGNGKGQGDGKITPGDGLDYPCWHVPSRAMQPQTGWPSISATILSSRGRG